MTMNGGPGRRPIPADIYLVRWSAVVESLKAGLSIKEIHAKHGICAETVRHIRRFMVERGWTIPQRKRPKAVKPKPPKPRMTGTDLIRKYPGVVRSLRKGKTMKQASALAGVSINTICIVRRALIAQGEMP